MSYDTMSYDADRTGNLVERLFRELTAEPVALRRVVDQ